MSPVEPAPRRISRVGIIVEFEDGGGAVMYADGTPDTEVNVRVDRPRPRDLGGRVQFQGPPRTTIVIAGAREYRFTESTPTVARHALDIAAAAVGR